MAMVNNGIVQFESENGETITTGVSNVVFIKAGNRNLAFYGSKGRSTLTDSEFENVHNLMGVPLPVAPVKSVDVDDDADFVLPN